MKKLAMAMMLGVAALSANAQVNYRMQTACNCLLYTSDAADEP